MKRAYYPLILLLVACATAAIPWNTPAAGIANPDEATAAFDAASMHYAAAATAIVHARGQGRVDNAQWKTFAEARDAIDSVSVAVAASIEAWRRNDAARGHFDVEWQRLVTLILRVDVMLSEVPR